MNGKIVMRIVSALVLIAAIAGIAFFAYQAGVAHGSPVTIQAPAGQTSPAPYPYYGMPFYGMHGAFFPFFGFGFLGLLIPLFLLFLAFRAFRMMMWGPRWGHMHGGHGPWRHGWDENGVPPMFKEMHDRAHEASEGRGKQSEDKKE